MPRTSKTAKKTNGAAEPLNGSEAVARRAYEIYQRRGGSDGADLDDWLEAERELRPGPTDVTGPVRAKGRKRKTPESTAL